MESKIKPIGNAVSNKYDVKFKMFIITLLLIAVTGFAFTFVTQANKTELFYDLKTQEFTIKGRLLDYGDYFEGIEYATSSYFGRPTLKSPEGYIEAINSKHSCNYIDSEHKLRICLYLNIYRCEASKRSYNDQVIVYIGGGYAANSGSNDLTPEVAIKKYACKGYIFVSVNYRQGAFGYFSTGVTGTGNNGLYDVKLALEWIQSHISKFGGNPGNVTLIGAANGGRIVSLLSRLPEVKGLYHQLILTSESSYTPFSIRTFVDGQWASRWFAGTFKCSTNKRWKQLLSEDFDLSDDIYECLEKTSITELIKLDSQSGSPDLVPWPFILDGELVKPELLNDNIGHSVPTLFIVCPGKELQKAKRYRPENVKRILHIIGELRYSQFNWVNNYYIRKMSIKSGSKKLPGKYHQHNFIRHIQDNYANVAGSLLEAQATSVNDVLVYYLYVKNRSKNDKYTSLTPVCLGEDLFDSAKPIKKETKNWDDTYGNYISDVIVNFVKNADPTPDNSHYLWPWYDPYSPEVTILDAVTLDQKIRPIQTIESADFWLCQGGQRYIGNDTLPRFCNITSKN